MEPYCPSVQSNAQLVSYTWKYYSNTTLYYKVLRQNKCQGCSCSHLNDHVQWHKGQASASNLSTSLMKLFLTMCRATLNTLQPHQTLRLPHRMITQHQTDIYWTQLKWRFQCATDATMMNDRTAKTQTASPPPRHRADSKGSGIIPKFHHMLWMPRKVTHEFTTCCAWHEKWHMNSTKCCPCHEK